MYSNNYFTQNKVTLIHSGHDYFELLLSLINKAKSTIYIQSYILNNDITGTSIIKALIKAAERKVNVFLIVDGMASKKISALYKVIFKNTRIHFKLFEPAFENKNFYLGRRMHQKIVTIDNQYAIVGGLNIADRYNDMPKEKAWLDFAVLVEGNIIEEINDYCYRIWKGLKYKKTIKSTENDHFHFSDNENCLIRIRRNDWIWHLNEITISYIEMLRTAKKEIIILCSYFIPGKVLRRLLANASSRGVKIVIVTAGPTDILIAKYAERWLYDWILRNNIRIYEYQSTVLHGKIAICDDEWVTVGSYNINNLSAYASIEFNLDIKSNSFAKTVKESINKIIANECVEVTFKYHQLNKNFIKQFSRWMSYQILKLILLTTTFFFKKNY
jgi:cardiolipin synthase